MRVEKAEEQVSVSNTETADDSMIGQKWTEDEEVRLIDTFMDEKLSIKEIAKRHNRKEGGIRARLKKLRLGWSECRLSLVLGELEECLKGENE